MTFTSISFLLFFPVVALVGMVLPSKAKMVWILISSYVFYGLFDIRYVFILAAVTLVSYYLALVIETLDPNRDYRLRKTSLVVCICLAVGLLIYFKYLNFLIETIIGIAKTIHIKTQISLIEVLLPVGISFYTFQVIGYVIDVYKGKTAPEKNTLTYSLFVSFFPQITAGPIGRAEKLIPRTHHMKRISYDEFADGFLRIIWGYFLKLVISNRIGIIVDAVYGDYHNYSGAIISVAVILYSFQIYADFSGYSSMALGVAQVLGVKLENNFNTPYLAVSIRDFWRRWHISLSNWLRDYVYFPLGGSRCKLTRHIANIMIVFLISGLWHGASWTYVIWGLIHGVFQVIEILIEKKGVFERSKTGSLCGFS